MTQPFLHRISVLYKKSDQLLKSGKFGDGLWPLCPESGQFLYWLIRFFKLKRGLEVGAGVGYSTAWIIAAFQQTGGHLLSFEYFLPKVSQWEKHMSKLFGTDYDKTVTMIPTDFERWIHKKPRCKPFDFVLFDQRKEDYLPHLKLLIPHLKKGAFILADNVISHQEFCQGYLDFVKNKQWFSSVTLPIGNGMGMTRLHHG